MSRSAESSRERPTSAPSHGFAVAGPRAGTASSNAAHMYAAPAALADVVSGAGWAWGVPVALVWAAHVGLDRALGYGLKLPAGFQHTHLGQIGRANA